MRLIVDANILVGELLRHRGRDLLTHPVLELFIPTHTWFEAQHELTRRVAIIAERGHMSQAVAHELLQAAITVANQRLTLVSQEEYASAQAAAKQRIPQDPDDWHTVALALVLDAAILTQDKDFLGCGIATWTSETLRVHLDFS